MFKKSFAFTVDTWNEFVLGRIIGAVNAFCASSCRMQHHTGCAKTSIITVHTTWLQYRLLKKCLTKGYYPFCVIRFLD